MGLLIAKAAAVAGAWLVLNGHVGVQPYKAPKTECVVLHNVWVNKRTGQEVYQPDLNCTFDPGQSILYLK
jgi:hypothetical protein